jgi:hypothetical protein
MTDVRMTLVASVGTALTASYGSAKEASAPITTMKAANAAIDYTAFAAALAVLVADGASPTQAHVTTANNAWTTLKALVDTAIADALLVPAVSADVVLVINGTQVVTKNKLDEILRGMRQLIEGSSLLT